MIFQLIVNVIHVEYVPTVIAIPNRCNSVLVQLQQQACMRIDEPSILLPKEA